MRLIFALCFVFSMACAANAQDAYPDDPQVPVPASPQAPAGGAVPASPPSPSLKPSKLWPINTVPVFMLSCTQLQKEIVSVCRCTIDRLMKAIPHDEFLQLSEAGLIEKDQRYLNIRQGCLGTPSKQ